MHDPKEDVEDSKHVDVNELGAAEVAEVLDEATTSHAEWTTTRKELWCFYLYYIVRSVHSMYYTNEILFN